MKGLILWVSSMLFFTGISFAQNQMTLIEFENLCDSSDLIFTMPEGFEIIEIKENPDLGYSFAVINEDSSMEIRYTILPLDLAAKEYEKSLLDSNSSMISPNKLYSAIMQANVLNMTGGKSYEIGRFHPQAVRNEFNADAGGSCFLEFDSEFGKGYKYGQFMYLHKDDIADVIVTFMSNNKETHADLMMLGFYSLKFK